MSEKCFCHLNGFAVKDATARAEIEDLKQRHYDHVLEVSGEISNLEVDVDMINTEYLPRIRSRITALEESGGTSSGGTSSGGKLYQHNVRIDFYRDDLGSEYQCEFFYFQFPPSSSADKIEGTFNNSADAFSLIPEGIYLGEVGNFRDYSMGCKGVIIIERDYIIATGTGGGYEEIITDISNIGGDPVTRIVVTDDVKEL